MLGKTHIAVGVTASLAIVQPATPISLLSTIAGGAIGGWICDIDVRSTEKGDNTIPNLILLVLLAGGALFGDYCLGNGVWAYVAENRGIGQSIAAALFVILCIWGIASSHRTMTHSLFGLLMFSLLVYFIARPLAYSFFIGYGFHILLDLFNKRGINLFFPFKAKICFGLCDADGTANRIIRMFATISAIILAVIFAFLAFAHEPMNNVAVQPHEIQIGGHIFGLSYFQFYIILINIISFIAYITDYYIVANTSLILDEDFDHTILNMLAIAGGVLGALLSFLVLRQKIGKHNANWYAILISLLVAWTIIYCVVYDPFNQGFNSVNLNWQAHIPLLLYTICINSLTAVLFIRDASKSRPKWSIAEFWLFLLGLLGGALGGYIVIIFTNKKTGSPHFSFGFPVLIAAHAAIVAYLLFYGIA